MYECAKDKLLTFIEENYDLNDKKIVQKLNHTFHVVDNASYICDKLNLNEEDKVLAKLIALLHDIGRFDQTKQFNNFREDITTYDHATLGVKLLFDTNLIREFISDNKYDEIIKKAIGNHSKYILDEKDMTDKEVLHSKIIRDADKIDSFRGKYEDDIFVMANITVDSIENSVVSNNIYEDFMNEKTILSKDRKTSLDMWVSYIAFIFGLYFDASLEYIKENDYVNKLINKYDYKIDSAKEQMEAIRNKANNYIMNR